MKLYASVSSERATKGQGGNMYLHANFNVGERKRYEFILEQAPGEVRVQINDYKLNKLIYSAIIPDSETKGEKQKGECDGKHEGVQAIIDCPDCAHTLDSM